ncbi:hypothetical protein [Phenylobacterium sp.]|uniref:DUF4870 family protein n=1 Tax=Phenylobacterium sp. TaxID=1871053 RepID=UPI002811582C|nr:hypothetical protein [Phenylobacterium sp.]
MTDRLGYGAAEDRTMPAVVYGLYFLAFATGITALIGLVIAYAQRDGAGAKMRTHYTFLIRTFWMSIAWWIIGGFLVLFGGVFSIILVGLPFLMLGGLILALVGVWWAIRCVVGVIYLARDEPYPRPEAWLA